MWAPLEKAYRIIIVSGLTLTEIPTMKLPPLETCANVASIVTPVVGLGVWSWYQFGLFRKRKKLERFLKLGTASGCNPYHTIPHLMQGVGLTQDEVLQASYKSRHIGRYLAKEEDGCPDKLIFKWEENANARIESELKAGKAPTKINN